MPFKKIGKNKYKSPSGRTFTEAQVKLYYATDGFKNKRPKKGSCGELPKTSTGKIQKFELRKKIKELS